MNSCNRTSKSRKRSSLDKHNTSKKKKKEESITYLHYPIELEQIVCKTLALINCNYFIINVHFFICIIRIQ
jgi:hypothetical protein